MRHIIMVNPVSGRKKGYKHAIIAQKLLKKYDIESEIITSTYAGQLRMLAHDISHIEKARFYSIGGDGTLNEIASGIIGTESEIVVLPCGTGNDFSRCVNEYSSLRKIILTSINASSSKVDIIKLNNNKYCINILNAGFDALIAYNMNKFRWVPFISGTGRYNLSIFYTLFFNRNFKLRIKTNNDTYKNKFTLVAFANAKCYGGGIIPCKEYNLFDNKLNMCLVKSTSIFEKIYLLPKYKKCKHENISKVTIDNDIQTLSIVSNKKFPLAIDGEIIFTNRVKAQIIPKAINIVDIKRSSAK